ncbi:hypothetical protein E6C50_04325 [Flavobacterium supellecticarium]|uniref:Uncharacterized protein n=1 Tax=Flavobacterium supellecticarium TaxID=2565924 RepID=A0A4S4A4P1_9FLAO|nr:hypothetical protein [Flavobacterium supellecticarium]THF53437.1 hypothetical protein E6C50_04325 [Flavobacterium supellecticarium]
MENAENEKRSAEIMFLLIRELWYQSDYGQKILKNVARCIYEVNKSGCKKQEVAQCFLFLIDNGLIREISKEQQHYEFTDAGKNITTQKDLEDVINRSFYNRPIQ